MCAPLRSSDFEQSVREENKQPNCMRCTRMMRPPDDDDPRGRRFHLREMGPPAAREPLLRGSKR